MREATVARITPPPSLSLRARLARALEGACEQRIVRIHLALPIDDPWAVMRSPLLEGRQVAAWANPSDDRCFLAVGAARARHPEGSGRFQEAASLWKLLDESLLELPREVGGEVDPSLPCLVAGFAFSATGETRSELWRGWGDSALWVPEILIHRRGGQTRAVLTAPAPLGGTLESLCERIEASEETLRLLSRAAEGPAPAPGVAGKNDLSRTGRDAASYEAWCRRVEDARARLTSGQLQKVVLARIEHFQPVSARRFDPLGTATALRARQAGCTTFCVRLSDGRAFVGSTPEELVRLTGREIRTMALAGTRSRGWDARNDADLGQELMQSDKERREQVLVASAIREALAPVSEDLDIPEAPMVARFADVQHLKTEIRALAREGITLFDLVERLHPTPAVGGLPRQEALAWLDANEGLDRGWYAGPLGWVAPGGGGVFVVALRSALLKGADAAAFAGCGLVERSEPGAEWQETIFKFRTISQGLVPDPEEGA